MNNNGCGIRHQFDFNYEKMKKMDHAISDFRQIWKCECCGYVMDENIPSDEYSNSYYCNITSGWDPATMQKSEIETFEISYVIDTDRYQIVKYSPNKLVFRKTWGGLRPDRSYVEKAEDWQKDIECILTDEEDSEIQKMLMDIDFASWGSNVDAVMEYIVGVVGCRDKPAFFCTFKNQPYTFFRVFYHLYHPQEIGDFGEDYEMESDIVDKLKEIGLKHGVDLPGINIFPFDFF